MRQAGVRATSGDNGLSVAGRETRGTRDGPETLNFHEFIIGQGRRCRTSSANGYLFAQCGVAHENLFSGLKTPSQD